MMRITLTAVLLALAACAPEPVAVSQSAPPQVAAPVAQNAGTVGALLHAERSRRGLGALDRNARLDAAARGHAQYLARTGRFTHSGQGGSDIGDRVRAQGYGFCFAAENIAKGQRSAAEVMAAWMNSAGHRRNNLSPQAREFGVARAAGDLWVLVFGRDGC